MTSTEPRTQIIQMMTVRGSVSHHLWSGRMENRLLYKDFWSVIFLEPAFDSPQDVIGYDFDGNAVSGEDGPNHVTPNPEPALCNVYNVSLREWNSLDEKQGVISKTNAFLVSRIDFDEISRGKRD